ncbi:MAG: hypothetical protein OEZ20_07965, partial [candidate division WOR-3 bacterium]|nr:hypothetical protein [candidate division WOR-3 bacterium]
MKFVIDKGYVIARNFATKQSKNKAMRLPRSLRSLAMTIFFILAISLLFVPSAWAIFDVGWHDAGLLYLKASNYGMFGYENCGIWPRGTNEQYIFGAGIWICALQPDTIVTGLTSNIDSLVTSIPVTSRAGFDSTRGIIKIDDEYIYYRRTTPTSFDSCVRGFANSRARSHLSAAQVLAIKPYQSCGYNPSSATSEFAPGDLPNEPGYTDTLDRIYFSDNPNDTAIWPRRTPQGEKIIISNLDSYAVLNDLDSTRHDAPGKPLNIKIIQIGYSWYYHYYEDFLFFTYLIINNSDTDTLSHIFAGCCCDADIGDATDDLVGSDSLRNLGYAWDSDFSEPGWQHIPGYIGFDFLESPVGPGGQLGLTAFKILRNPGQPGPGVPDPANDLEAYLTVAGYDHPTGIYRPFDTIDSATDVRFVQCTGPFVLAPQETARVVIAVIYGADTLDLAHNSDLAQGLYDANFVTHKAWVLSPNGGEEISGDYLVTWRDSSATGAPLLADVSYSRDRGKTYQDIVTGIPSTGSYLWNTRNVPDGTRYLIRITVYDTLAVGEDVSDTCFIVNNPGNGVPDLSLLAPIGGSVRSTVPIRWEADDPDHDSLLIDLFLSPNQTHWDTIATGLINTGSYQWNTYNFHNGDHYIMVKARDQDTFALDISPITVQIVNDHPSAAPVHHTQGGCNTLSLSALEYDPSHYTGHTYEVSFKPIIKHQSLSQPIYRYILKDLTIDTTIIAQGSLSTMINGMLYSDFSPIIDGFALQFDTQVNESTFRFIDFYAQRNRSGCNGVFEIHGADSLGTAPPTLGYAWAYRGSNYEVRWVRATTPDSLTLQVTDLTNNVSIPYDSIRSDNWFLGTGTRISRYFNRTYHRGFYLCGGYFWFNRLNQMTIPPDSGDIWIVNSSGHRVPCLGNLYMFTTPVGIEEDGVKR